MLNLSFQTSIVSTKLYCIQKAHLLPSSFLRPKKLRRVELVLCIKFVHAYMLNLHLFAYHRFDIVTSLTVPHCSTMATSSMILGARPSNNNVRTNFELLFVDGSSFEQISYAAMCFLKKNE